MKSGRAVDERLLNAGNSSTLGLVARLLFFRFVCFCFSRFFLEIFLFLFLFKIFWTCTDFFFSFWFSIIISMISIFVYFQFSYCFFFNYYYLFPILLLFLLLFFLFFWKSFSRERRFTSSLRDAAPTWTSDPPCCVTFVCCGPIIRQP